MAQRKGQTGNPKGRKPGVPNKVTRFGREFILEMLETRRERIGEELDKLTGRDFINAVVDLMAFAIPKPSAEPPKGEEANKTYTVNFA